MGGAFSLMIVAVAAVIEAYVTPMILIAVLK